MRTNSSGDALELRANAFEGAGDAALHEWTGLFDVQTERPVHLATPVSDGVVGEQEAGIIADAVVVDSEVDGVGMRNVNSDEWDAGGGDAVGDNWSDLLLDLEFDDEVDAGADKFLGVLKRCGCVVTVVEDQQVDARSGGSRLQAFSDGLGERHFGALAGEAEAQLEGKTDQTVEAVARAGNVAAMEERLKDAVDAGLGEPGALIDGLERHGGALGLEQLHNIKSF